MNTILLRAAAAAAFALAAPAAALAAPATANGQTEQVRAHVAHATSSVHDMNGVRTDVPSELLRPDGTLINGLDPQPQQFD